MVGIAGILHYTLEKRWFFYPDNFFSIFNSEALIKKYCKGAVFTPSSAANINYWLGSLDGSIIAAHGLGIVACGLSRLHAAITAESKAG